MAEDETTPAAEGANGAETQVQAPKMRILTQFIRDMSFENILAQKGKGGDLKPEIQVQVNLDARKRQADNQYEVSTKFNITSKAQDSTLFALELDYAGVFEVTNVPEAQLHPYLLIECPRMIFPFVRRIVADVTRDGGFPPLNLDTIDFVALYRQMLTERQKQQAATTPAN
ncbi:protein-export chaperone SecB [Mesobaculum littorinae]|uniref:Protein-export protein SecB n=1 Tax=Mesobaculum littorinae TaxID=2486419 RepID=A0A438AH09_9RHOB|nr:protein-export chaperone SecB [Mesobaculum littorinae]RVV98011.1 protein-export chaperone SecB [Mesobaculum littorinae]